MAATLGAISYCDNTKLAEILQYYIYIYEQCKGIADDTNLIIAIRPGDLAQAGLTERLDRMYKDVMTAASPKARDYTSESYDVGFDIALQNNSSSLKIHEIISGVDKKPDLDPLNPGGYTVEFADNVGKAVRKYIMNVVIKSDGKLVHSSWMPNVAIKSSSISAYNSGENHNITLNCTCLPDNLSDNGVRMIRHFPA